MGAVALSKHDETVGATGVHNVEGECNAHLYLADDLGDNVCTIRCNLPKDHMGKHHERFMRDGDAVIIQWVKDERRG